MAQFAITAALTVANMALTMSRKIEGPRLEDTRVTTADPGTPRNHFWGTRRVTAAAIWKTDLIEERKKRKTKGGKTSESTYYGNWMLEVAGHASDDVLQIFMDAHLVYDRSGKGPISPFSVGRRFHVTENTRIHLGADDQMPDPLVQAEVESREGPGSCPAYRRKTTIVFQRWPVEKFGNRIPTQDVIATRNATVYYPSDTRDVLYSSPILLSGFVFSPDYSRLAWPSEDGFYGELWDVAARLPMLGGELPVQNYGLTPWGVSNSGHFYYLSAADPTQIIISSPDGLQQVGVIQCAGNMAGCTVKGTRDGLHEFIGIYPGITGAGIEWGPVALNGTVTHNLIITSDISPVEWTVSSYVLDGYGSFWAVGTVQEAFGDADTIYFLRLHDGGENPGGLGYAEVAVPSMGGIPTIWALHCEAAAQFVIFSNAGVTYAIDDSDFTLKEMGTFAGTPQRANFENFPPGSSSFWVDFNEYSLVDLSLIRSLDPGLWGTTTVAGIYDPVNHAIITANAGLIHWNYLDRASGAPVTFATVFGGVADLCGISAASYDVSVLTQPVPGWSVTHGVGKEMLEPLFDMHHCELRPHGFLMEGIVRGGASAGTIVSTAFARGDDNEPPFRIIPAGESDLPLAVNLKFADVTADQQPDVAQWRMPGSAVEGDRVLNLDMSTYAMNPDDGIQYAQRLLRAMWVNGEGYELGLTGRHIEIEPGDDYVLDLGGRVKAAMLRRVTADADGVFRGEWEREDSSIVTLSGYTGAGMDGRTPSEILVPALSKGFLLDIPLTDDADNDLNPLLYAGAAPYAAGPFPGAIIYQGDGVDEYSDEFASVAAGSAATWGFSTAAIGDASPAVWDRGSVLNVQLQYGELHASTEAACNRSPRSNLVALGAPGRWELLQFADAALQGDGSWNLSGLKRGRRGTEWATGLHITRDLFVLIEDLAPESLGLDDVGDTLFFKAVTGGRDIESALPITIDFRGQSLMPRAPTALKAVKDPTTGDIQLTFIRRTRVGGAWTGGSIIPLGETGEAYEMDVFDAGVVVRTLSSASESFTYEAADQVTDFGAEIDAEELEAFVYQISASVGRGFPAALAA